nr:S-layer homology domain-containing protein [Paenibacillus soyae]
MVTGSTIGGLIGERDGNWTIENSYYNRDLTSVSAGGQPLSEENMTESASFAGWNFADDGPWGIIEGLTYPMHRKTFDRIALDALEVTVGSDSDNGAPIMLDPSFVGNHLTYSGTVPNEVDQVTVYANAEGSLTSIDRGSNSDKETIDLNEGANIIHITVSSSGAAVPAACEEPCTLNDPYELTYTLQINREDGSNYPHSISTVEQLAAIGTGAGDGYQLNDDYILHNDMDLSEYLSDKGAMGWVPIGDADNPFTGSFDGNGHVIHNLFIDRGEEENIGFFGVASGTIKNIGMTNVEITGELHTGAIVGTLLDGGTVSQAYSTGTVTVTGQGAGGVVGKSQGELIETYSTANVIGSGGADHIGGLIGEADGGTVTDSYAAGQVTSDASSGVGGLIGSSTGTVVTNSFWDVEASVQPGSAGGSGAAGKGTAEMKAKSTYANAAWNFAGTWAMMEGTTYPIFDHEFEAAKLTSLSVTAPGALLTRSPPVFDSEQGLYTITSDRYIDFVDIGVVQADSDTTVSIAGTAGASEKVTVTPGVNEIMIETADENGNAYGRYKLRIQIPAPEINDVEIPGAGYYGIGDALTFVISYEGPVDAPAGTPRLPIVIGEGADTATVYSAYTEQPAGERNKLVFAYEVQEGFLDTDGIEIGMEIDLPVGAALTASGVDLPLDVPATGTNGIIVDSIKPTIALTPTPATSTMGTVTVTAATDGTGSDIVTTKWAKGSLTVDYFASGGTLMTGDRFDVTSNGTYTVYTEDEAGNGVVERINVNHIFTPIIVTPNDSPPIDLNGQPLDPTSLDASKPTVTLEVTPKGKEAYVSIPAAALTRLGSKNESFVIEIKTPYGSYQVPVNLASLIPGLTELLAENNLKADEISFKITLTDQSDNKEMLSAFASGLPQGSPMGAIVDFRIDIVNVKTKETVGTADKFSQALTRIIPMPKNVTSMPLLWGAFRYNEADRKFEFVPAKKVRIDGVWYIAIDSYSNSVYVVAENSVSFTDALKHWGASYIEQAAAKGLVEGIGGGKFAPDKAITRAEFAAMLVRALGRGASTVSAAPFDDVKSGAWYYAEVSEAKQLGLLEFEPGSSFKPNQQLTREEMASMLAAVIALEKLPTTTELSSLDGYHDIGSVTESYLEDVRLMVKLGIMTGTSEHTFSPKHTTTRAQAAAVLLRTLHALGRIDE